MARQSMHSCQRVTPFDPSCKINPSGSIIRSNRKDHIVRSNCLHRYRDFRQPASHAWGRTRLRHEFFETPFCFPAIDFRDLQNTSKCGIIERPGVTLARNSVWKYFLAGLRVIPPGSRSCLQPPCNRNSLTTINTSSNPTCHGRLVLQPLTVRPF